MIAGASWLGGTGFGMRRRHVALQSGRLLEELALAATATGPISITAGSQSNNGVLAASWRALASGRFTWRPRQVHGSGLPLEGR